MSKTLTMHIPSQETGYAVADQLLRSARQPRTVSPIHRPRFIRLRSGTEIGEGRPCFVVAEIGNNHQGEVAIAREMLHAAAESGVSAVKFQKRDNCALLTREGLNAPYSGPNSFGKSYGAHRAALELTIEEMAELKDLSEKLGLVFFASAWDRPSLVQMAEIDVELLKVCSADLVNVPLLRQAGAMGLPVILSTGMSSLEEIDIAMAELRRFHDEIIILHCNSSYPCPEEEINLPVMHLLKERYGTIVGYSGHEAGLGPSLASVAMGACVVERHMTLDRTMRGTDHKASLEPEEFARLVSMIREVERTLAHREKVVTPKEKATADKLRKSIVAARDLRAGSVLTEDDLTVKSPGTGLSPIHWDALIGATLTQDLKQDQFLRWESIRAPVM